MDAAPFLMMLILSAAAVDGLPVDVVSKKLLSAELFSNPVSVSNTAIFWKYPLYLSLIHI